MDHPNTNKEGFRGPSRPFSKPKLPSFPLLRALRSKVRGDRQEEVAKETPSTSKDLAHGDSSLSLDNHDAPSLDKESFPSLPNDSGDDRTPSLSHDPGSATTMRSSLTNSLSSSVSSLAHWTGASMVSNWVVDSMKPTRRMSSLRRWANRYRYSSVRPRVTATSHYVASSSWGIRLEQMAIPWVPGSIESFIRFLFLFSFALTLPFAITKLRTGRWTGELYQQAILNWCLTKLGFQPMFDGKIAYLPYATDQENPTRPGIDLAFWAHLVFGLSWIVAGGIQILTVNTRSRKFHRRLGWITTAIFTGHIGACLHGLWRDVVHHTVTVKALLLHDLVAASCYVFGAVYLVVKKDRDMEKHRDMMIRGYLHAIEGSGTIRFTGWILWLLGNTVGGNFRLMIDTTACQSQYITAAATNCVVPYVFRLQTLRLLTLYFMALYLRTPEKARDKSMRVQLADEIYSSWTFLFQSMAVIYVCFQLAELEWIRDLLNTHEWLQLTAMACYTAALIRQRSSYVREVVLMPRRNAFGVSTVAHLEEVQRWEEEQEPSTGVRAWFNKSKDD